MEHKLNNLFFGEYVGIIGFDQAPDVRHGMAKSA
jgi:hypothetical protein